MSAPVRHSQMCFSGGECSPSLFGRVDLDRYRTMLRTCRNGIVHPQGGWSNRAGTKMIVETKNGGEARAVKFIFSETQAYVLEFGDYYVRFCTDRAQILSGGVAYEVATPYPIADVFDLQFEQSADTIYITHPLYQQRTLSRYSDTDWRIELYVANDGPFLDENTDESSTITLSAATGTGVLMTAAKDVFTTTNVGGLWKVTHYVAASKSTTAFAAPGYSAAISCFTTWRLITHGTWTGAITVEKSSDAGVTWTALASFSSANDFNANTSGTEDPSINLKAFLVRVNCTALTSGTANVDISTDAHYNDGIARITSFNTTKQVAVTILDPMVSIASSFTWAEGAWSDRRGWPRISRFYLDRLVFAGTTYQPMTEWMSMAGNYTSFRRNTITLLASDGITTSLTSRQLNAINGMLPFKRLLFLTSGATWSVGPLNGSALGPTTVDQEVEEYYGSSGVAPVTIGNEAIYAQNFGRTVRSTVFQLQYNGFSGSDINVLSRHLTDNRKIICMDYQQSPDSIVWMACDDGVVLGLTYLKEQDVCAWHRHDTDGDIESLCVIPGEHQDEVWMVVNRPNGRYIEVMEERLDDDVRLSYFVDNGVTVKSDKVITAATNDSPVVVTVTAHGYVDDDLVDINGIVGMTVLNGDGSAGGINGFQYKIKKLTNDTFELYEPITGDPIDGTEWSAYESGGTVGKAYTTFTGLDWLAGMECSMLANGYELPLLTLDSGTITLPNAYSVLHIGLPYDSDFETLNIEIPTQVQPLPAGSTQARSVKIPACTFRLLRSRGGKIGPSELNQYGQSALYEAFIPDRTSFGLCPPLQSYDRRVPLGGGYKNGGRVFLRQSSPLPLTILEIVPDVSVAGPISGSSRT